MISDLFYFAVTSLDVVMDRVMADWPLIVFFVVIMLCASSVTATFTPHFPFVHLQVNPPSEADDDDLSLPSYSPVSTPGSTPKNLCYAFPSGGSLKGYPSRFSSSASATSPSASKAAWMPTFFNAKGNRSVNYVNTTPVDPFTAFPTSHSTAPNPAEGTLTFWFTQLFTSSHPSRRPSHSYSPPVSPTSTPHPDLYPGFSYSAHPSKDALMSMRRSRSFPLGDRDRAWIALQQQLSYQHQQGGGGVGLAVPLSMGMKGRKRSKKYAIRKVDCLLGKIQEEEEIKDGGEAVGCGFGLGRDAVDRVAGVEGEKI